MSLGTQTIAALRQSCRCSLRRSFSTTSSQRNRVFVEFTPSSQPELDSILEKYRETLFVPENLSKAHRRLIYRPSRHHVLTNETGVKVSVSEEEEVALRPMSLTERPRKRESLSKIAQLLSATDDPDSWKNLLPFLEGMKSANATVPVAFLEKVTRKANELGVQHWIIECADQPERSGYYVQEPSLAFELLLGCHNRLVESRFKGDGAQKAIKQARHIINLMSKQEQSSLMRSKNIDMRQSLFTNAIALEITAAEKLYSESSNLPDDAVARAVRTLMSLSDAGTTSSGEKQLFLMPEFSVKASRAVPLKRLEVLMPALAAMKLAQKIPNAVAKNEKAAFVARVGELEKIIAATEAESRKESGDREHGSLRAVQMHNKLKEALAGLPAANA